MAVPFRLASRRAFLASASGGAAFLAAHHLAFLGIAEPERSAREPAGRTPRILRLELHTAAPLGRMREFYQRSLGLRVLEDRRDRLTLQAGETRVTFVPAARGGG